MQRHRACRIGVPLSRRKLDGVILSLADIRCRSPETAGRASVSRCVQREAQRRGAGIAEAIGLARHDGVGAIGQPARRERPGPLRVGRHGGGNRAAVDAEVHHGVGKPAAGQRSSR